MKTFEQMMKESNKVSDQNSVDSSFHSTTPKKSIRDAVMFDVQWSDCPDFVEDEITKLWRDNQLGNDVFMYHYKSPDSGEFSESYPYIYGWLKHNNVEDKEVIIHWWW